MFLPAVLRALGARVGRRVHIHRGVDLARGGWDLLEIGDDVTLAQDAASAGRVRRRPDRGGPDSHRRRRDRGRPRGPEPAQYDRSERLPHGPLLAASGRRIAAGERWDGVPAAPAGESPPRRRSTGRRALAGRSTACWCCSARCAGCWCRLAAAGRVALRCRWPCPTPTAGPGMAGASDVPVGVRGVVLAAGHPRGLPSRAPAPGARPAGLGRVRPGVVEPMEPAKPFASGSRRGVVDSAGRWLSGAIFWPWWLRLAGMRIGRGCEISTIIDVVPETVTMGDESFFADGIYFCGPWRHRGTVTVAESTLGRNTFLGNHAVVPSGAAGRTACSWASRRWPTRGRRSRARPGSATRPWNCRAARSWRPTGGSRTSRACVRYATRVFWELLRFALPGAAASSSPAPGTG